MGARSRGHTLSCVCASVAPSLVRADEVCGVGDFFSFFFSNVSCESPYGACQGVFVCVFFTHNITLVVLQGLDRGVFTSKAIFRH